MFSSWISKPNCKRWQSLISLSPTTELSKVPYCMYVCMYVCMWGIVSIHNPFCIAVLLFIGNMIYMKNSSLLMEIFGHYGNNEIHTFHRLALMFGVFYARVHPRDLTDHLAQVDLTLCNETAELFYCFFICNYLKSEQF